MTRRFEITCLQSEHEKRSLIITRINIPGAWGEEGRGAPNAANAAAGENRASRTHTRGRTPFYVHVHDTMLRALVTALFAERSSDSPASESCTRKPLSPRGNRAIAQLASGPPSRCKCQRSSALDRARLYVCLARAYGCSLKSPRVHKESEHGVYTVRTDNR